MMVARHLLVHSLRRLAAAAVVVVAAQTLHVAQAALAPVVVAPVVAAMCQMRAVGAAEGPANQLRFHILEAVHLLQQWSFQEAHLRSVVQALRRFTHQVLSSPAMEESVLTDLAVVVVVPTTTQAGTVVARTAVVTEPVLAMQPPRAVQTQVVVVVVGLTALGPAAVLVSCLWSGLNKDAKWNTH